MTLLVMVVGGNVLFDPSREELAVADGVMAVSVAGNGRRLLSVRMVDPPARGSPPGVPDSKNSATGGTQEATSKGHELREEEGVWCPPRGGMARHVVNKVVGLVVGAGSVAEEVIAGLKAVEVG